jgi:hypothetical protein
MRLFYETGGTNATRGTSLLRRMAVDRAVHDGIVALLEVGAATTIAGLAGQRESQPEPRRLAASEIGSGR